MFRSLLTSQFTRNIALLTGSTVLAQGVVIASAPILTRLYAPEDFGVLGVFLSLVSMLTVIATLCYDIAIPLPDRDDEGFALLGLSLLMVAATTAVVAGFVGLSHTGLIHWTIASHLMPHLWLLPVCLGFTALYQAINYWAVRNKAYRSIAATTFQQNAVSVTLQIIFFSFGTLGLLLGQVAGKAAGACTLIIMTLRREQRGSSHVNRDLVVQMARRYRRFPKISCSASLINAGGTHLPVILFAALYGPFVAGQFALVQRVVGMPMMLLGRAVSQVYFSEGASLRRQSHASFRRLFLRASKGLALVAIFPLAVLLLTATWLFPFVFGSTWTSAGQFAFLLGPAAAARLIVAPLSQTLNVLEYQSWQLGWDATRLLLVLLSIGLGAWLGWSPTWNVAAYSLAMCIAYLILWGLSMAGINQAMRVESCRVFR